MVIGRHTFDQKNKIMATKIETSIQIKASAERVWGVFTNSELTSQWLTGLKSSETISGRPLEVGSKHRMVFDEKGKDMVLIETVTNVQENREYAFSMSHESMSSLNKVQLFENDGQTEILQSVEIKPRSFMFKLFMPFMKGTMKKRMNGDLVKLKNLIENN